MVDFMTLEAKRQNVVLAVVVAQFAKRLAVQNQSPAKFILNIC